MHKVDGLCCPSGVGHMCVSPCMVKVNSIINLEEAFKSLEIATMIRLLVVNILMKEFPNLVYVSLPTCNNFDAVEVQKQWDLIHKLHQQHLQPIIGPLISHGSDGDVRKRSCMLTNIA
jgi:hypothetical protein